MKLEKIFSTKRIVFLVIFAVLVFLGSKVNFSPVVGAKSQFFTLYQFFGPIAGGFLGPIFGAVSVLIAQVANYFIAGKAFSLINIIRLTPMLFAAYYFGTKRKSMSIAVPLICMALFILHPVGRHVWFFSLYWLIPVIGKLPIKVPGKLLLRSLGATFTAHAVGSTAWIWTVPMEAGQWIALIPIVAYERILFGAGIAISYVVVNAVLDKVVYALRNKIKIPTDIVRIDPAYLLGKKPVKA